MGTIARDKYTKSDTFGKLVIRDCCYLGNNALIMTGNNVLITVGSVATKSIPSGYVVGDNSAKNIMIKADYIKNMPCNFNMKGLPPKKNEKYNYPVKKICL